MAAPRNGVAKCPCKCGSLPVIYSIKIKPEGKGDFTLFRGFQIVQQLLHGHALMIIVSKGILYAINLKTIGMRLL